MQQKKKKRTEVFINTPFVKFIAKWGIYRGFLKKKCVKFWYKKKKVYLCGRKNRGVAQLVVYLVWDQVVARSSRVTPTHERLFGKLQKAFCCCLDMGSPDKSRGLGV